MTLEERAEPLLAHLHKLVYVLRLNTTVGSIKYSMLQRNYNEDAKCFMFTLILYTLT